MTSTAPLFYQWPAQKLETQLRELHPCFQVIILAKTDSTNTQLMNRLQNGDTRPTLFIAEQQTAARGRMGKKWDAHPSHSLMFSILLPAQLENIGWLALVSACALVQTLHTKLVISPKTTLKIKWPNDIWIKPADESPWHKLAGILIETASVQQQRYAVVGVGINISPVSTIEHYQVPRGNLEQLGASWDAPTTLLQLVPELVKAIYNFKQEDIPNWKSIFQNYDLLYNHPLKTNNEIDGVGAGINNQGQLLINTGKHILTIHSGEISIRPCSNI